MANHYGAVLMQDRRAWRTDMEWHAPTGEMAFFYFKKKNGAIAFMEKKKPNPKNARAPVLSALVVPARA